MTIEIGTWAIPAAVNVVWLTLMVISFLTEDNGWFSGVVEFVFGLFGTMFIWLVYFAVMYFITV